MNDAVNIIMIIYGIIAFICLCFYFPRILYWFEPGKKHKKFTSDKKHKIALIIPAKNESKCIGRLIKSIKNQNYDSDKFDVFVIVDNKNDKSIEIVKSIMERANVVIVENQKCKGDALDGCFSHMFETGYECDEISIIDADNALDPNYLAELNNAMASNRDVIVSQRRLLNHEYKDHKNNNWVSNCGGLTHTFQNEMGNWYRSEHDIPLNICGTGLSAKYSLIKEFKGWPFKSIAEDAEFTFACKTLGKTSYYAKDAILYSEESSSLKGDINRRVRWVNGFSIASKLWKKKFNKKIKEYKKFGKQYYDARFSLSPLVAFIINTVTCSLACLVTFIVSICLGAVCWRALIFSLLVYLIMYLLIVIYTAVGLCLCKEHNKMSAGEKLAVLIMNPIYCGLYIIVYFKAAFKSKNVWVPTERLDF